MLPMYNESHTYYSTPSGNTQIYIVQKKPQKKLSSHEKYERQQKLLGIGLLLIGALAIAIFPEDAMGGLFASGMGLLRVVCNN